MISISSRWLVLLALAASFGCTGEIPVTEPSAVIVFIADGTGAASWEQAGLTFDDLATARMPAGGLMDTRGSNNEVAGDAPAATAIATGVRSFMGAVGGGPDSLPRESVLEVAHGRKWGTGLVTTGNITDPTPAAFAAHVLHQSQRLEIFQQMMDLPVHVLLGGGARVVDVTPRRRAFEIRAQIRGQYTRVSSVRELQREAETESALLGFFAPGELPPADRRSPSLAEMTEAALRVLARDPDGFFLMVENKGPDTQALRNGDREAIVAERLAFDDAVGVGLEYQSGNPGILILVIATAETGGIHPLADDGGNSVLDLGTGSGTGVRLPIFAIGPGAERFGGAIDNDEVGRVLLDLVRGARAVPPNPDERP